LTYDQVDRDGDNIHGGVYEEYWISTNRYKRIYKSDNFTQTDYATDRGLYRQSDQQWPNGVQSEVRAEVAAPFAYAASLEGVRGKNVERTFSGYQLQCVLLERDQTISDPTQYCLNLAVRCCAMISGTVGTRPSTIESYRIVSGP
jgi:hypothetical protein